MLCRIAGGCSFSQGLPLIFFQYKRLLSFLRHQIKHLWKIGTQRKKPQKHLSPSRRRALRPFFIQRAGMAQTRLQAREAMGGALVKAWRFAVFRFWFAQCENGSVRWLHPLNPYGSAVARASERSRSFSQNAQRIASLKRAT
ncbi:hypothetical protein D3C84_906420 [compost metagenome]